MSDLGQRCFLQKAKQNLVKPWLSTSSTSHTSPYSTAPSRYTLDLQEGSMNFSFLACRLAVVQPCYNVCAKCPTNSTWVHTWRLRKGQLSLFLLKVERKSQKFRGLGSGAQPPAPHTPSRTSRAASPGQPASPSDLATGIFIYKASTCGRGEEKLGEGCGER